MKSVLTNKETQLERKIECFKIIGDYKKILHYDVSYLFNDITEIEVYKCLETGYRFFYPFNISGDTKFYEFLQLYDWYYMPWKWEHEQASRLIEKKMKVLEVGCGQGDFLLRAKKDFGAECVGLEFNEKAINDSKLKGLNILSESIENHSINNMDKYDIVCSFQVLEHISNVKSFIESQILCLKKNGLLIISVPNNDSFLDKSYNILNMPPHHMGLWNRKSLKSLANLFGLEVIKISLEPLQSYHKQYFDDTTIAILRSYLKLPAFLLKKIVPIFRSLYSKNFKAFTIQITYKKL
jgi:2-polyprenyl-3-methyl-5-hydroxy-6-metoxy-1,4-benzoquinol methylase